MLGGRGRGERERGELVVSLWLVGFGVCIVSFLCSGVDFVGFLADGDMKRSVGVYIS